MATKKPVQEGVAKRLATKIVNSQGGFGEQATIGRGGEGRKQRAARAQ